MHTDRWLDVVFGMGDDDFPFWLMAVRTNILLFLACLVIATLWQVYSRPKQRIDRGRLVILAALTVLAAFLRFAVASANLIDLGGIPYSRLLLGYRGHFATAQFYSIFYELTARDIEHAILFNRIVGSLTIPAVYVLCALWEARRTWFPAIAALLFATSPLHILFSASDSLAVFSVFLAAISYALLLAATRAPAYSRIQFLHYLGGFSGLVLLTQVRYENALFLIPAGLYVLFGAHRPAWPTLLGAAAVAGAMLVFNLFQLAVAGISYQTPVDVPVAAAMVFDQVLLNPFVGFPLLAVASLAAALRAGVIWGWSIPVVWATALALALPGESGHGAARGIASWLVLILPISAYGLTHWLRARWAPLRVVAATVVFCLAVQPLLFRSVLEREHLEIVEHRFFKQAVRALPREIQVVVVPDDELLRRHAGSTVELLNKYSMTLAGMGDVSGAVRLVRLTDYLERPDETPCQPGTCAFFFGLPCSQQQVYPFTRDQCLALQGTRRLMPMVEQTVRGAPFVPCSIYAGRLRAVLCEPAMIPRTFGMYRIASESRKPTAES